MTHYKSSHAVYGYGYDLGSLVFGWNIRNSIYQLPWYNQNAHLAFDQRVMTVIQQPARVELIRCGNPVNASWLLLAKDSVQGVSNGTPSRVITHRLTADLTYPVLDAISKLQIQPTQERPEWIMGIVILGDNEHAHPTLR